MSLEVVLGAMLLLAGLWFASTALFPTGPQVRAVNGAGGALSRGVRGIFVDPEPQAPSGQAPGGQASAFVDTAGRVRAGTGPAAVDLATVVTDPAFAVTLQQTLTVLEEVLAQLPGLLARTDGRTASARRSTDDPSSRFDLTVSRLLGESLPPALSRNGAHQASPLLNRLFELCEEESEAGDGAAAPPAPAPRGARVPPRPPRPAAAAGDDTEPVAAMPGVQEPGGDGLEETLAGAAPVLPNNLHEGTPMSNPNDPQASDLVHQRGEISADVAAEMFEVAMHALAQALVDDERAVREASMRAVGGIERDTLRRWASVKLLTGGADDMAAAARIVSAVQLHEVVGEILERALDAGSPQRDRAVGALRALAPSAELLDRTMALIGESSRARLVGLLPELFEGPTLTAMLQVLVRDPSEQARMAALDALALHADRDTVLRIASNVIAVDQSPAVRVVAADLLGRAGTASPAPAAEAPAGAVGDVDDEAPPATLPDDPKALWEVLLEHAGRGDDEVVTRAAEQSRETLMAAALAHADDADPAARALAVRAALRAGTEDGVVIAMLALADPDPQVRRAAVEVCHRIDATESSTSLRRLVTDPDHEVRKAAVEAVVRSDDLELATSLVVALADPEDDIRATARAALLGRTSPDVARLLVDELEVEGGREVAAEILLAMGDTGREAVEQAMASLSREALVAAGPVLAAAPGVAGRYLADLASLDTRARLRAVRALGAMGGQQAITALVGRLQDPVDDIRIEALDHLGRIAEADVVPLLRRIRASDPVRTVAAAAERALTRVLERTDLT